MMPPLRGLYAITDDTLLADRLLAAVADALAGGCRLIQYRSKHTNTHQRLVEAQRLVELCHAHNAYLVINDDTALAKAVTADGVHLGQNDMPLTEARRILGKRAIIGITCHNSLALAQTAQQAGANYVAFGRFFHPTPNSLHHPPIYRSCTQPSNNSPFL